MAAHSGSDTLRLHLVGPSPCASALALDTRHRPVCGRSGSSRRVLAMHKKIQPRRCLRRRGQDCLPCEALQMSPATVMGPLWGFSATKHGLWGFSLIGGGVVDGEDVGAGKGPAGGVSGGALVCVLAVWWSVCGDLGGRGAGAGFVHDGLAVGVGGDERLDREVVDGSGQAAAGGVDQGDGVVADSGSDRPASLRWWWM